MVCAGLFAYSAGRHAVCIIPIVHARKTADSTTAIFPVVGADLTALGAVIKSRKDIKFGVVSTRLFAIDTNAIDPLMCTRCTANRTSVAIEIMRLDSLNIRRSVLGVTDILYKYLTSLLHNALFKHHSASAHVYPAFTAIKRDCHIGVNTA